MTNKRLDLVLVGCLWFNAYFLLSRAGLGNPLGVVCLVAGIVAATTAALGAWSLVEKRVRG